MATKNIGGATVYLAGDSANLEKALNASKKSVLTWGESLSVKISGIQSAFSLAGNAISIALKPVSLAYDAIEKTASALKSFSDEYANVGSAIKDQAARIGISAQSLSELTYAAKLSGVSMDSLTTSLNKQNKSIEDAYNGTGEAAKEFAKLGLNIRSLKNMSADEAFMAITDAIGGLGNQTEKTSAAMNIWGRSGSTVLQMISGGIRDARSEATSLGITFNDVSAADADKLGDALDTVKEAANGVKYSMGYFTSDAFTSIYNSATDIFKKITKLINETFGSSIKTSADAFAATFKDIAVSVGAWIDSIDPDEVALAMLEIELVMNQFKIWFDDLLNRIGEAWVESFSTNGPLIEQIITFTTKAIAQITIAGSKIGKQLVVAMFNSTITQIESYGPSFVDAIQNSWIGNLTDSLSGIVSSALYSNSSSTESVSSDTGVSSAQSNASRSSAESNASRSSAESSAITINVSSTRSAESVADTVVNKLNRFNVGTGTAYSY